MWSSRKKPIEVFFVLSEGISCIENMSEMMYLALQDSGEHELTTAVVSESEVCDMKNLKKSQIFVYDKFEGPAFQHVLPAAKQNSAVMVSPICLRTCFSEAIPVPEINSPIYTMAMHKYVISVSNLKPQEKERIKEKIMYMGGIFSHHLRENTTHLMVGKVGSKKYTKAIETGITIMTDMWVDAVWEESLSHNIDIDEDKFDKYKCPPFYKLNITTSGLDGIDRDKVMKLVNSNGGTYTAQMKKEETNVLIVTKPKGQKFTYAQQWGLICLKMSWVLDSVIKGYMVETDNYIVEYKRLCSTLTSSSSQVQPKFSQADISEIVPELKSNIDETINNNMLKSQKINNCKSQDDFTTPKKNYSKSINYKAILNDISFSDVKKAGTILDGCKIYFSGFSLSEEEKLKRIVISTGGIKYTELNESITHILVGDFSASLAKLLHSIQEKPHVVNLNWLVESINLKCTAPEEQFLAMDSAHLFTSGSPSPLSKKGLYMMKNASFSQPKIVDNPKPSTSAIIENRPLDSFINQYLNVENAKSNVTQSQKSSCTNTTEDTVSTQDSRFEFILEGLTILLYGLDAHQSPSIKSKIISMGGIAVITRSYEKKIDYTVVPIVFNEKSLNIKTSIVNCLWIEDCYNNIERVSVEYYHKPVIFSGSTPLKNCVITVTNYAGSERYFLKEVSLLLGAHYQDAMARKQKLECNIMATTHLICSAPEGHKYQAAVKWNVPVVSKEWLLECVIYKCRLPEDQFPIVNTSNSTIISTPIVSSATLTSRNISYVHNKSNTSFTQKLTIPALQENDTESELAVPLKDTEEDIEPPLKKKCSMEINNYASHLVEPTNKLTPTAARLKSSISTPIASNSFMENLKTPDTPYGQFLSENPVSSETKKRWKNWINTLPDGPNEPPESDRMHRNSTPLSELKRQVWQKFLLRPKSNNQEETDENSLTITSSSRKDTTANSSNLSNKSHYATGVSKEVHKTSNILNVKNNKPSNSLSNTDTKQQSLDKQEFKRTMEELQQDLCTPKEPEIPLLRSDSDSQEDHAKHSLFKERVVESSQQCSVGWEDPTEQQEKARLKRLTECNKKFILTSVQSHDRQRYEDAIEKLGAQVLRCSTFSKDVTHVLMHHPSKSEKYLCSLASGKWILHPSYIDACLKENCFLPEDKYEWGNPLSNLSLPTPLHGAGYRWRSKNLSFHSTAFNGMKAVVMTSDARYQALKRLIEAGGGVILDTKDLMNSTHCIVDQIHVQIPCPLNELASKGILLLPAPYLADFLIKDPPPDPKQCLIPEYVPFYNRLAPNS